MPGIYAVLHMQRACRDPTRPSSLTPMGKEGKPIMQSNCHASDNASQAFRRAALTTIATIAGVAALMATPAMAQQWPARNVTIVVPFPAGGNTDTMARLAADYMSRSTGKAFVVENRPAGGGIVAAAQIATGPADGHTLLFAAAPQIIVLPLLQQVKYNPQKDFKPVSVFGTGPFILGVKASLPVKNLKDVIAYGKASKEKINFASAGRGSIGHLSAALFAKKAGFEPVFVPYKGGGPAMNGLLNGDVDMYFGNASELIQHKDGGKIRLIAVSTKEPIAQSPEVPPVATIFPDFETSAWNGFLVAAATPAGIVSAIEAQSAAAVKDPAIRKRLDALGIRADGSTSKQFEAIIAAEIPLYKEAIAAAGLKMDGGQ
jgi:tripartite-type tricarboxylate transporter receptor subunit TctC